MSGYFGYSMSNNAKKCYDNGVMPKSKWTKEKIINQLKEYYEDEDARLFSFFINDILSVSSAKEVFLKYDSWHHTSKFYNCTEFYRIDIFPDFKTDIIKPQNKKEAKKHYNDFINLINDGDITFIETLINKGFQKDTILYFLYENTYCPKKYTFFNKLKEIFILDTENIEYLISKKVETQDFSILNDKNYKFYIETFYGSLDAIVKNYTQILDSNLDLFAKYYPKANNFCKEILEKKFINYEQLEYADKLLQLMKKCNFETKEIIRFKKSIYIAKKLKKICLNKDSNFLEKIEILLDLTYKHNATMCVDFIDVCNHYEVFSMYLNKWAYMYEEHKYEIIKNKIQELKYFQNPTNEKKEEVEKLWLKLLKKTSKAVRMIDEELLTDVFLAKAYILREYIVTQLTPETNRRIFNILEDKELSKKISDELINHKLKEKCN